MGYHRAGFDEIVGVDIVPQKNYPFTFILGDALNPPVDLAAFDLIHASPPCQAFSVTTNFRPKNRTKYPDVVAPTRLLLANHPHIIENVVGAPLLNYVQVCGTGFNMRLQRHRWFEATFPLFGMPCAHGRFPWDASLKHSTGRQKRRVVVIGEYRVPFTLQQEAMGIDWMTLSELSEAIPPAYTEYLGRQFLDQLT